MTTFHPTRHATRRPAVRRSPVPSASAIPRILPRAAPRLSLVRHARRLPREPMLVVAAFLTIYLVWGSTFAAIHVALGAFGPLTLTGARFTIAGVVLLLAARWLGRRHRASARERWAAWRRAVPVGLLLFGVSGTLLSWAEQTLPTSVAALIGCLTPVFIVLMEWRRTHRAPAPMVLVALGIGLLGVFGLVGASRAPWAPALVLVVATMASARAATWMAEKPEPGLAPVGRQMVLGGGAALLLAIPTEPFPRLEASALAAMLYLVVVGSALAYVAFAWLLARVPASTVSTHAFVNPLVAVGLGAAVLGESLTAGAIIATGAILVAVVLLVVGESTGRRGQIGPASGGGAHPGDR